MFGSHLLRKRRTSGPSTPTVPQADSRFEPLDARLMLSGTYHLTFDDEFNTLDLADKSGNNTGWMVRDYWYNSHLSGNNEQQYYCDPAVDAYNPFSIDNGILTITAEPTPAGVDADGQPYVSGELTTTEGSPWDPQSVGFAQQYGYFEIRCKLPEGQGLWPAFWLLAGRRPVPPEYDIFEVLGHDTDSIHQTAHWDDGGHQMDSNNYAGVIDSADGFHNYGFEWTSSEITWYVDGVLTETQTNRVDQPMYMLLNLAVGGDWPGYPDATTPWPAEMQVDYVRVYSTDAADPDVTPQSGYSPSSSLPIDLGQGGGDTIDFTGASFRSYDTGQDLSGASLGVTFITDGRLSA